MTTLNPATRLSSPELAVTRAGPQIRVRLPAGGWQVGFRAQHDGRTVIEVTGQDGSLAGLVASSRPVIPSATGGSREVHGLRKVLLSPWLTGQLASLLGYDPSPCGERFA